jgi:hypothetical protein
MMFSLVIAALPVGVIGGNFANVWEEQEKEKAGAAAVKRNEAVTIKASFQRYLAYETMSHLMLIDVWNERFPPVVGQDKADHHQAWNVESQPGGVRPLKGEFMGCVRLELPFTVDPKEPFDKEFKDLPLVPDPDVVQRKVSGHLTVRCVWKPYPVQEKTDVGQETLLLAGDLTLTVISAKNLINLNLSSDAALSNPYCMAICYPKNPKSSPAVCSGLVRPVIWRTPLQTKTLNPEWNASHTFKFAWYDTGKKNAEKSVRAIKAPEPPGFVPDASPAPKVPSQEKAADKPQPPSHVPPSAQADSEEGDRRDGAGDTGGAAANGVVQ